MQAIKFNRNNDQLFFPTLRKRVDEYFKTNNISKHANAAMVFKTVCMILLYLIPYTLLMTNVTGSILLNLLLWLWMGVGVAGIGLSIMHDANHGAYSKNRKVNKMVGLIVNLVGGYDTTWKIQHNVLHHTYTNVHGHDADISPGGTMRFSPHDQWKKAYRFQHIYAWFLYGMMTILWITVKDFKAIKNYRDEDLLKGQGTTYAKELRRLIAFKAGYWIVFIILPLFVISMSWWVIVLGIVINHFISGFILGCIFQPAHVMEENEFPVPDEEFSIDKGWAELQLATTQNYAPKSRLFSWYVGGLNFQIEHHLFPNICHVHYKKISKIVSETAKEFGLPYHSKETFAQALIQHARMLKKLGQPDPVKS